MAVSNWWFWRMVRFDLLVAVLSLGLSVILSLSVFGLLSKFSNKVLLTLFLLVSAISLYNGSDRGLFLTQPLENDLIERRHEYLAKELGKVYRNRVGLYYHKKLIPVIFRLQKNFFSNLDINLYFFTSHTRERVGVDEFSKFPFIFLPFASLGLIKVFWEKNKLVLVYFILAALVSTFLHPTYNLGPVLFFPLINLLFFKGLLVIIKYEKI